MRIIGGKYRGRRIEPPSDLKARPTTDFAREGLFNILSNRIDFESSSVLDLFSGTGSISYEFSSRGAASVHLVEKNMKHVAGINRIIKDIGFENIRPIHIDVRTYIKTCQTKYDVIFADPPYDLPWLPDIPSLVMDAGILNKNGFFILEHPRDISFNNNKYFFEHRNYGGVNFSFFREEK
ncbi:MAG TPA: RsmD family RNA methyltransferase [Bacteroidales bacterium]|nr:RsmD family RNA methyltransferase [Bacteroidales bacterium]